jgi:hypothetical protein
MTSLPKPTTSARTSLDWLPSLLNEPTDKRIDSLRASPGLQARVAGAIDALKVQLFPASDQEVANAIYNAFTALSLPVPNEAALEFWYDELGHYPADVLAEATRQVIRCVFNRPTIADFVKAADPLYQQRRGLLLRAEVSLKLARREAPFARPKPPATVIPQASTVKRIETSEYDLS